MQTRRRETGRKVYERTEITNKNDAPQPISDRYVCKFNCRLFLTSTADSLKTQVIFSYIIYIKRCFIRTQDFLTVNASQGEEDIVRVFERTPVRQTHQRDTLPILSTLTELTVDSLNFNGQLYLFSVPPSEKYGARPFFF